MICIRGRPAASSATKQGVGIYRRGGRELPWMEVSETMQRQARTSFCPFGKRNLPSCVRWDSVPYGHLPAGEIRFSVQERCR